MRKWKIGLLGAVVLSAAMMVPVFVWGSPSGAVSQRDDAQKEGYVAFQIDNRYGVKDDERFALSGGAKPFFDENSRTQLPLRAAGESVGLTVSWDDPTKTATLTDDTRTAVLTIGKNEMTLNGEAVELPSAPVVKDGSTYIPARALESILGWTLEFLPADQGNYIIFKSDETRQVSAEVARQLGASVTQYLANGLVVRVGSDHAIVRGTQEKFAELTTFDDDTSVYLPVVKSVEAMGGTVTENGGQLTVQFGEHVASLDTENNKATVDRKPEKGESFGIHKLEDTVYVTDDLLAALLGLNKTALDGGVIAFTVASFADYEDQTEAIAALGAALPDPRAAIPEGKYYVALTFDDGPTGNSEGRTARLLNGLNQRGAHATFFLCGYRVKDFHAVLNRYLEEGHELGNHTMDHKTLTKLSVSEIHAQVDGNSDLIAQYAGAKPTVMRPTGGAYNDTVKAEMKKSGLPVIMWSVDTLDWKTKDAKSVENAILNNVKDGDIVLMHDLYETTLTGVLNAIDKLQEKGYAFVTVSELAEIKGVTLEPGEVYNSFK